jgi:hypothetical protein
MSQAQASQCITGITGEANLQPATQSTRRKRQQIRAHPRDRNDSGCDFACKNGSVCILPFHVSYPETLSAGELLKAGILIEAASHAQDGDGMILAATSLASMGLYVSKERESVPANPLADSTRTKDVVRVSQPESPCIPKIDPCIRQTATFNNSESIVGIFPAYLDLSPQRLSP